MAGKFVVESPGYVVEDPGTAQATAPAPRAPASAEPGMLEQAGRQVALGARGLATGAAALPALGADVIGQILNLGVKAYNASTGSSIPEFPAQGPALEKALTAAGVPAPETAGERVAYDVNRAAGGAASSVGAAGAVTPATAVGRGVASTLASRPLTQAASAMTGAAASGVTREAGGGPGAQFAAGLAGGFAVPLATDSSLGMRVRNAAANVMERPVDQTLMEASRGTPGAADIFKRRGKLGYDTQNVNSGHDVPLAVTDIRGGPVSNQVTTTLEKVPGVGMGGFREVQHDKAMTAANRVREELDTGGENWAQLGQASMVRKAERAKQTASRFYDELASTADPRGDIPLTKTVGSIDKALTAEKGAIAPDKGLISALEQFKANVGGNFSRLRDFRSDLGSMISDYYKGTNAMVGAKGVGALQAVRSAVDDDMATFAQQQGGDVWRKWKQADGYYKANVVPLRERSLAQLAKTADPDELYRRFLTTASSKPETLYNSLGPAGKSAVRYGLVNEAYENALSGDAAKFSPAKFAKYLEDRQSAIGVFFKGADKEEIDGFTNLMRHAERAGQFKENPPTGNRLMTLLMTAGAGAGAVTNPGLTAGAAGAALATKLLFTTEAGKRLLLASARSSPSSPVMEKALKFYAPAIVAAQQTNRAPDSEGSAAK